MAKGTKRKAAAASSPLSREEWRERAEAAMQKAVEAAMRKTEGLTKEGDAFLRKLEKALKEASMRSMLMLREQYSIETLPRFQIDMHCTAQELRTFFDDRGFRFQLISSLKLVEGISATPPEIHITHQLVEVVVPSEMNPKEKVSVMQFAICECNNYVSGFRLTPPEDPYQRDGFFTFGDLKIPLPDFFGVSHIMKGHSESYEMTTQVELRPGFIQLMTERLRDNFTAENCMFYIAARVPYLQAPMVLFGECQRSLEVQNDMLGSEDGPFGLLTAPLDTSPNAVVSYVTPVMDKMFHNWSALSKVALWFYIAILELDIGSVKDALISFMKARMQMRRWISKMGQVGVAKEDLQLYDADGVFSLKQLLGRYLLLVKYEEKLVVRCIMRSRLKFGGTYDKFANSKENERLQGLWDTDGEESDVEESDGEESDGEESDGEESDEKPNLGDKREWNRWLNIKEQSAGEGNLLKELMK